MSTTDPCLTIVTPTFNRRAVLDRAIRSVLSQEFDNYEYLIVDDGSTDDTWELVSSYRDSRIRYIRLPQREGANVARNVGIREARASWITFLDSDDEFLPHRLTSLCSQIQRRKSIELFLSSFRSCRPQRSTTHSNPAVTLGPSQLKDAIITYAIPVAGTSITAKRETLLKVGGFDPTVSRMQDREVLLKLSDVCGCSVLADVDWVKHHSEGSISGQSSGYVKALGHVLDLHPDLAAGYRGVLGYSVARNMLRNLFRGNWSAVCEDWQSNRDCQWMQFGLSEMLWLYRTGKTQRRLTTRTLEGLARVQSQYFPFARPTPTREFARLEKMAF
ncbi:glycosyltransferase family 2 protein [Bremerella sp.]|uniref:glycosyltransferase family 2 protein n=1 Tax=Bremerella sp. TaxID=2795602 RepID=UPI00391BEAFC